jgi:putative flippase GtrA
LPSIGEQGDSFVTESRLLGGADKAVLSRALYAPSTGARKARRGASATGRIRELGTFASIGVASTVLHLGLFAVLRSFVGMPQLANAAALLTATVFNTAANRRLTFGVTGRKGAVRQQVQGLIVFAVTLGFSSAALSLLHGVSSHPGRWAETVVVAVATLAATLVKYLAMRRWMFSSGPDLA